MTRQVNCGFGDKCVRRGQMPKVVKIPFKYVFGNLLEPHLRIFWLWHKSIGIRWSGKVRRRRICTKCKYLLYGDNPSLVYD